MSTLHDALAPHVAPDRTPGVVALVGRGSEVEFTTLGSVDVEGSAPMARDTIFRIASITKPITAAAVMLLVEDRRIALDDPVGTWLPEIASPMVVRTPSSPVEDAVPAARAITVFDLLTSRAGWGFPSDFSLPAVGLLFSELGQGPPQPQAIAAPDDWMRALSKIPLLHQPGEAWLYNACSDILGVLIARVSGQSFPDFLAERIFVPLGMVDTGFFVPADQLHRFTSLYTTEEDGPSLRDAPDGQWSTPPAFPSGTGGLVSTIDDWLTFGRVLLADGRDLLTPESVRQMTTDYLTPAQREGGALFLEGQGWGFGGTVDVAPVDPWNVDGRYGWVGGTGTTAHIVPSTGMISIMLSQVEMGGPAPLDLMRDFWAYAAGV
ncbi:MAG TPA: serine hydrolase domain-containing protein [Propionibacteriaceae bacterium]